MSKKFFFFLNKSKSTETEEKRAKGNLQRSQSEKSTQSLRSFEKRRSTWRTALNRRLSSSHKCVRLCIWFELTHEIMALFVRRKLILQTCMHGHPMGLDV